MNVLERLVEEELARVPAGPSPDDLRRRARARRARRAGSATAVAIVFAVFGIAAMLQTPTQHRVQVTEPAPTQSTPAPSTSPTSVVPDSSLPLATAAEFPPLAKIVSSVSGSVKSNADPKAVAEQPASAEIVATTDTKAWALWGGSKDDKPIYVVQVTGKFVCNGCSRPNGAGVAHGDAFQVFFDPSGTGFGFGFSPTPKDLSTLGTVYRLGLP